MRKCRRKIKLSIHPCLSKLDIFADHIFAADDDGAALMEFDRLYLKDSFRAIDSPAARMLCEVCHRDTLIQQTEFPFGLALGSRIEEYTTLEKCTMHVCDHSADIT